MSTPNPVPSLAEVLDALENAQSTGAPKAGFRRVEVLDWLHGEAPSLIAAAQALTKIAQITQPLALLLAVDQTITPSQLLPEIQRINRFVREVLGESPA